jgi:hypothetical protein
MSAMWGLPTVSAAASDASANMSSSICAHCWFCASAGGYLLCVNALAAAARSLEASREVATQSTRCHAMCVASRNGGTDRARSTHSVRPGPSRCWRCRIVGLATRRRGAAQRRRAGRAALLRGTRFDHFDKSFRQKAQLDFESPADQIFNFMRIIL